MNWLQIVQTVLVGLMGGIFSGLFGVGGGVIIVPALVLILGFSQKMAQGTTLLMLMFPVVALGVYKYYQSGNVDLKSALTLALGFFIGGYIGGHAVQILPSQINMGSIIVINPIKKLFALLMIFTAIHILLEK